MKFNNVRSWERDIRRTMKGYKAGEFGMEYLVDSDAHEAALNLVKQGKLMKGVITGGTDKPSYQHFAPTKYELPKGA